MPHIIFYCNLNPEFGPEESPAIKKKLKDLETEVENCQLRHTGSTVQWLQSTGTRCGVEPITQITAVVSWQR